MYTAIHTNTAMTCTRTPQYTHLHNTRNAQQHPHRNPSKHTVASANPPPASVAVEVARAAGDTEGKSKLGNVSEGTSPASAVCPPDAFRGMLVNSLSNWAVSKLCSICGLHGGCTCPRSKPSQSTEPKNVCDWISNVLTPAPHPIRLLGSFVRSPPSSDLETCERYGGNVTGLLRICSKSSSRSWQ